MSATKPFDVDELGFDPDLEYDEEQGAFGEPARAEDPGLNAGQKASLAAVVLGLLGVLLAFTDSGLNGTWLGFALSFGLLGVGIPALSWFTYKDTPPGIQNDGVRFRGLLARGALGWAAGIAMTALYVLLYWYPQPLGYVPAKYGPDGELVRAGEVTGGLVELVEPLARLLQNGPSSQWFLYGVLYTGAVLVFGVRMLLKYRHSRYQVVRTLSVMFFQTGFAFLIPAVLQYFRQPYYELNGVWPLKYDYLWPSKVTELWNAPGAVGTFLLFWGLVATFIATPVLTYFYGKRWYCSWVCGCGGLAETLGDPWRQLSSKTDGAWKVERWMIHSVLVFVLVATALVWADSLTENAVLGSAAGTVRATYGFLIGAVFSGVVGVGFYPLLGSRVWCRFGCPMAAVLGIQQRIWSRFRITTNGGQCMSCGNCSTYCEMGIDVRAYAQQGRNIVRASCVGCGVCSAVCPRGVLKLENGPTHGDRFEGAERPLSVFVDAFKDPDIHG